MSMPLVERIEQIQSVGPTFVWTLRTIKGKIIYVKYHKGALTCRYDNEFSGKMIMQKAFKKNAPSSLSTLEMLRHTQFMLDHQYNKYEQHTNKKQARV